MGPRPFSRGNVEALYSAPIRTRFNGAATFQPRKPDDGPVSLQKNVGLQWGRDLSAAETTMIRLRGMFHGGFNGAATFQPRKHRGYGRECGINDCFNGAATFQPRKQQKNPKSVRQTRRFNGAATFQPRKPDTPSGGVHAVRASMGPRPFSRGNAPAFGHPDVVIAASMGPRPFSRGNLGGIWHVLRLTNGFNGAATFQPRKQVG